ncbi:uncharacterized protein LOC111712366 isoform X2 [Eurytemora carolleeae]|uniref:uncharacterized protein LOC111712366 isoform X2 n=1 Tax=Eurytemora carolleeae TaxID=1294199 RepID=UPI000C78981E|nr:uncharacterized protein LOC111712366 isoform X2 [Eurytemora carolleeae]|eukprot:XP_023342719.1 uncharacterized protein LOC111712366 isoform X2 [Eurytemora affinis]
MPLLLPATLEILDPQHYQKYDRLRAGPMIAGDSRFQYDDHSSLSSRSRISRIPSSRIPSSATRSMRTLRRSQSFSDLQHPSLQYSQLSSISEFNITNTAPRKSNKPAVPQSEPTLSQTRKSLRRSRSVITHRSSLVRFSRSTGPEHRIMPIV